MLHLIWKSYTDEGFGRNVYKNVFFLSLYIYIFSKAHSKRCFKNSIDTQRKTLLVNVSAKDFISITFHNQMEHTYR